MACRSSGDEDREEEANFVIRKHAVEEQARSGGEVVQQADEA